VRRFTSNSFTSNLSTLALCFFNTYTTCWPTFRGHIFLWTICCWHWITQTHWSQTQILFPSLLQTSSTRTHCSKWVQCKPPGWSGNSLTASACPCSFCTYHAKVPSSVSRK
jgi:hypothetical protein